MMWVYRARHKQALTSRMVEVAIWDWMLESLHLGA